MTTKLNVGKGKRKGVGRTPRRYKILCRRKDQSGMHDTFTADSPTELDNLLSVLTTTYLSVRVFSHLESIGPVGIYDEVMIVGGWKRVEAFLECWKICLWPLNYWIGLST